MLTSERKRDRNQAGPQRMGSVSLAAVRSACVMCERAQSFWRERCSAVVSRSAVGCDEPSSARLGSRTAPAAWRVTTMSWMFLPSWGEGEGEVGVRVRWGEGEGEGEGEG